MDMLLLAMLVAVLDPWLRKTTCLWSLQDIIKESGIDSSNTLELQKFFSTYQPKQLDAQGFLLCKFIPPILELLIFSIYTLGFWIFCLRTPAKFVMRLKIVDHKSLAAPTKWQLITDQTNKHV
jgi:hypothetical protein